MKERGPIFYDAERVRWRRTRRVMEITGVLLTLLLAYFFVTIAVSVELPAGLLPDTKPGYRAVKSKKKSVTREGRRRRVANIGNVPASYDPVRAAFFVSWDPNSLASLKKHYKDIDLLIPEQLHAVSADGALTIVDYERGQYTTKATPAEAISILKDDKLHQWMKSLSPPVELPTMGLINNYDGVEWRIKEMAQMFANPAARHKLARDITEYAVESHEAGIVVDFEEVPDASQAHFRQFIATLAPELHSAGLKLMIALPARDDAYDYEFFGNQCDAIVVMNYDQHWLTSPPGPIAAQDWFVENLRQVFDEPVLGGDGARRRSKPVLVVIHHHDGVALVAKEFVIVSVVACGQSDHQLQARGVQLRGQRGDELAEVRLAGVGDFFEVNNDSSLMRFDGILGDIPRELMPRSRIRKHLGHFLDAPLDAVVVVDETHRRQLDGRAERFHPLVQLVVLQYRDGFGGRGFGGVLSALIIHDGQRAIGRDGMELFGNQQVDIFVMLLERSKAVRIPTHEKCSPHGVVACRDIPDVRHATAAAFASN